jgi:hypothetical protein
MSAFTEVQAGIFKDKASKEKYFTKFVHYNSYLQITYTIPKDKFNGFKVPQWSMVSSFNSFENSFILILCIFNDNNFLYDIDTCLKYDFITLMTN